VARADAATNVGQASSGAVVAQAGSEAVMTLNPMDSASVQVLALHVVRLLNDCTHDTTQIAVQEDNFSQIALSLITREQYVLHGCEITERNSDFSCWLTNLP